ncbi:hypothetical protein CA951_03830 [Rhodococcus sp. NCIMB 12038]|nr:hypothetical protein CA951_03830 [Rhodococcus sp. NCIMB 12038]
MSAHDYRRWSRRRRAAWIEANRQRKHPDSETERLITFASMWAPYGGVSEEEILVHLGSSKPQFVERLWQAVPESNDSQDEIRSLACAYPCTRVRTIPHPRRGCLSDL